MNYNKMETQICACVVRHPEKYVRFIDMLYYLFSYMCVHTA